MELGPRQFVLWGAKESSMTKLMLIGCALAAIAFSFSTPASAQYRFDFRIDPDVCHWTEICDYGGRAYVGRRIYRARHVVRVRG
jgi:hypothetical protein